MRDEEFTVTGYLSEDYNYLLIDNPSIIKRACKFLKGEKLEITFKKFYKKRTAAQNRWLWGICIEDIRRWLYETTGERHSKQAIYTFLMTKVLGYDIQSEIIDGKEILFLEGKRFSEMTTLEFSDAVEKIYNYYAERGLQIRMPRPNTNNLITDYE